MKWRRRVFLYRDEKPLSLGTEIKSDADGVETDIWTPHFWLLRFFEDFREFSVFLSRASEGKSPDLGLVET